MRHSLAILLILCFLASSACAWGPKAHDIFCRDAVSNVWGENALGCLEDRVRYCLELKSVLNETVGQECLDAYAAGLEITPANAPLTLFFDTDKQYNFESCPLTWARANNEWICSGSGNPAQEEANLWFTAARKSDDICTQVRLFCTGAFYYTSSFFPLHRVKYLSGCLNGPFEGLVDQQLESGISNWSVKEQCTFSYMKPMAGVSRLTTQHVTFILDFADFNLTRSSLTFMGEYVRNPNAVPPTTIPRTLPTIGPTTSKTSSTTSTLSPEQTSTTGSTTTTSFIVATTHDTQTTYESSTTLTTPFPPTVTSSTRATGITLLTTLTLSTTTATTPSTTTTALTTTTTMSTTTTTLLIGTVQTTTTSTINLRDAELNRTISELDSLFAEVMSSVNQTRQEELPKPYDTNLLLLSGFVFMSIICMILLVQLLTVLHRPSLHTTRKVVLPPSMRRKMRKSR